MKDMAAAVSAPTGAPDIFKFACRNSVSANLLDAIKALATSMGISQVYVWSKTEFEEHLRVRAEFLVKWFVDGSPFPESETELRDFFTEFDHITDEQALTMLDKVFDRPAFHTPFHMETNLPAFEQAIKVIAPPKLAAIAAVGFSTRVRNTECVRISKASERTYRCSIESVARDG